MALNYLSSEPLPDGRRSLWIATLSVVVFAALVLLRLRYYPLWDDEVDTAIFGNGVWQTGDTSGRFGHNILAYKDGYLLDNQYRERCTSPLQYFIVAPFVGIFGFDPFFVRLPFALAGIATVAFGYFWLHQNNATFKRHALVSLGILGSTALILFSRQARYYSLTALFSLLAVYFYLRPGFSWKRWVPLSISLGLLLSSQYLSYAGVTIALCADYLIWLRRTNPLRNAQIWFIAASQAVIGLAVFFTWYPLDKENLGIASMSDWAYRKMQILWFNIRDINSGELGIGILVTLFPLLLLVRKKYDIGIIRLFLGILVAVSSVALFSPAQGVNVATLRYLAFIIPGLIYLTVLVIESLRMGTALTYMIAGAAFFSTLFHIPFAAITGGIVPPLRSTTLAYIKELRHPPQIAYAAVSHWLNLNVPDGKSALVWPRYATYPLMYHSPHLVYGWQFSSKTAQRFSGLSRIQINDDIFSLVPTKPPYKLVESSLNLAPDILFPDYIIVLGPQVIGVRRWLAELKKKNIRYEEVTRFSVNASHRSRPEILDHTFSEVTHYNPETDGAYVYSRVIKGGT